ncbi:CPBP family intramembrane metalloprotease [Candidatus Thorarchaeota archaeon]|nr:MAG: CPBP family intramembrane metalloprotease [Candidatus Thorarchaeota archaeon]
MVTISAQENVSTEVRKPVFWSSLDILLIAIIMLSISVIWRIIDQFVLGLGNTWMNILPSKLFPLLIILGFFWKYRRYEIDSILGLSKKQFRAQVTTGIVMVILISLLIDLGGTIIYARFIDPAYPLELHILNPNLLGYLFVFFLINAFLEESLFRGLLQNSIKTRITPNKAILISAVLFGVWHAGWPLVNGLTGIEVVIQVSSMIFFTTILGLLFGVYYEYYSSSQSLVGPIIAHTFFNFISECFKLGPEPVIQGPDLIFSTPELMIISLVLFFGVFSFLLVIFWRFKIEQIASLCNDVKRWIIHKILILFHKIPTQQIQRNKE